MPVAAALESILLNAFVSDAIEIPEHNIVQLYSKDIEFDRLKVQLQMLPDLLKTFNSANTSQKVSKVTSLRTIVDLLHSEQCCRRMFSDVLKLLKIVLTIPVTSATAERTFSSMRRLKNYLRSSMTQKLFNNMMILHIHKDKTDELDLNVIAEQFINVNERRNFFGK